MIYPSIPCAARSRCEFADDIDNDWPTARRSASPSSEHRALLVEGSARFPACHESDSSYFGNDKRVARLGNGELAQAVTWPLASAGRGYSRRLLGGGFPTDRRIFARGSAVHELW